MLLVAIQVQEWASIFLLLHDMSSPGGPAMGVLPRPPSAASVSGERRTTIGGLYQRSARKEPLGEGSFAKVRRYVCGSALCEVVAFLWEAEDSVVLLPALEGFCCLFHDLMMWDWSAGAC